MGLSDVIHKAKDKVHHVKEKVESKLGGPGMGRVVDVSDKRLAKAPAVAYYFSASWCPPCRQFTPQLAQFYNTVNASGTQVEVLFVPSDRDEESTEEYFKKMPWLRLRHDDANVAVLKSQYGVSGIPHLAVVRRGGQVVEANARGSVMAVVGQSASAQSALAKRWAA
eukprot:TRINITY_DN5555_c0_g1_i2.p1 TRINITY_DN5555_c0_g1~~TRINITY_DN5555_c0_g1_i2.p1  ORF type:complete len:167 (+),score=40.73 TRINITY_DN5555_c0_g1_i2:127-627(+)